MTESYQQKLRIVAIGDELLDGHSLDTNTRELAIFLADAGLDLVDARLIHDREDVIRREVADLLAEESPCRIVISTGGLGPTIDDRTRQVLAEAFGTELRYSEERWQELLAWFRDRGRKPNESNRSQALHPVPGGFLHNRIGTANGLIFEQGDRLWVALPGVPSEMRHLMQTGLADLLRKRFPGAARSTVLSFRSRRLPEADMHRLLEPLEDLTSLAEAGFYPSPDGVMLRLKVPPLEDQERQRREQRLRDLVRDRLGQRLLCEGSEAMVRKVFTELDQQGLRLGLAESCTGGWMARELTDIPGSSRVFPGGFVIYENESKVRLLGVSAELLASEGAVSAACVRELAAGARERLNADWALAVSGIAGPGGGSSAKPVGTVWLGVTGPDGVAEQQLLNLRGNREQIRRRAAGQAWVWLYEHLTGKA